MIDASRALSLNRWHGQVMKFDERTPTHAITIKIIDNILRYMQVQNSQSRTLVNLGFIWSHDCPTGAGTFGMHTSCAVP